MNADFAHLHVHTQYSLLDSTVRLEELFKVAVEDKMEAVAITDHGNMFGVVDFYVKAKSAGIKPILGCEMYLAPGSRLQRGTHGSGDDEAAPYSLGRSGLSHVVLLCIDEQGYHNLCQLLSSAFLEGFYYKPRIDRELLAQYNEGLIATSACLKGEISRHCLIGDMDRARATALWYKSVFADRYYLEMQQNGVPQQIMVNSRLQELAKDLSIPLLATADCHYLKREEVAQHEIMLAIQTGAQVEDPIQPRTDEFYFKPQAVMKEEFAFCPEGIANTMEIAKRCHFEFKFEDEKGRKIYHFPRFEPPNSHTSDVFLKDLSLQGLRLRFQELENPPRAEVKAKYLERLQKELSVINGMGFAGYFLIVADFIKFAKENGIPVGPGRGSGAGSLVAYSLRITELDPIEHELLFERFLNPERISLPDFDIDFCMDRREEVIRYVSQKYGKDCVAQIITFGKLQARGVIRDVGRVFGIPVPDVDKIAKLIPDTLNITLREALEQEPRLQTLIEREEKTRNLFFYCRSLEGLLRHASIHAAGLVISNRPMVEHCPLYRGKNEEIVIQYDMANAERIGLIKFDFLGLKTLTFLQRAQDLVNRRHPNAHLNLSRVDLKDKEMYRMLSEGDTQGVFQLESSGMQDLLRRVRPDSFADIVAIISLYRPGPMIMLDDFIARKHGEVSIQYDFKELEPILRDTYGIIVYQEQVQQIAMVLASYTAGGADLLRRAMGKKKPEEMAKQKVTFVEGAKKNGHDTCKAERLFDLMGKFAGYGFNKSHAAAYSHVTCQTAYLKAHYSVEFFTSLLTVESENTDKITKYISDAKKHRVAILPPEINESETDFTVLSDSQIRFGLGAIKGVGQIAINSILEGRQSKGPFEDLFDLCARTHNQKVNKRVLEALVKAGALDSFQSHRASLMAAVDSALEAGSHSQQWMDENQSSLFDLPGLEPLMLTRTVSYPNKPKWKRLEELKLEKEVIGFYVSGHPLDEFNYELKHYTSGAISDCFQHNSSRECFLGVQVSYLREILNKRGERMAFATFEDGNSEIEGVLFSDIYVEAEVLMKGGEPLWIKSQLEVKDGTHKLLFSKKNHSQILPLRHAYEALAREMHIHVLNSGASLTNEKWEALNRFLQERVDKSGIPIFLHLKVGSNATTTLRMKEIVLPKRDVVQSLQTLLGETEVNIDFR